MIRLLFAALLIFLLTACGAPAPAASDAAAASADLVIFAAASLTDALDAVGEAFTAANPGVQLRTNYAGSSQLAVQLLEGATADIFASANAAQMAVVQENGRITTDPVAFASNRLTIITPADNPAQIESLADLAEPGVLLLLAGPGVPVREYTDEIVARLADDAAYGVAFRDGFYANLVSEEDNVRQVAAKVALGEADAGIVYTSDVTPEIAAQVQQIAIPDAQNVVAAYPIAILADAPQPELAQRFIDFLLSDAGRAILERHGFGPPPAP